MYNHILTETAKRLAITLTGKAMSFTLFGLLLLTAANLNAHGQAADSFNPNVVGSSVSNIKTIVRQPDGKILIGGDFYTVGGQPRLNLARVNADGTLDTTFTSPFVTGDTSVYAIALQPDGKILVAVSFQNGGQLPIPLVRLNADGTRDTSFNLPQFNGAIYSMLVQEDGKIIVGGIFTIIGTGSNAVSRRFVARLSSNGSSVDSFDPTLNLQVSDTRGGGGGGVQHIIRQPDGKIILGGFFLFFNGSTNFSRYQIARVDNNGTFDSLNAGESNGGFDAIALQPDGKIMVGGGFSYIGNTQVRRIARLDANGAIDNTFNAMFMEVANNCCVSAIALQADGKILVSGNFVQIGGQARTNLARLNSNGNADSFNAGNTGDIKKILVQPDGKILIGGAFAMISGQPRNNIARLYSSELGEGTQPILFLSNRDGNQEIYRMNADGSNQQRLTNSTENEIFTLWSPDGSKILFTRQISTNVRQIWTMNADGSNQTRISPETVFSTIYRYSPNGQKILFARSPAVGTDNLWVMNADGSNAVQLTSNTSMIDHFAEWSPDGTKIAFGRCTPQFVCDIYTMNADGTNQTNLTTDNPANDDDNPKWTKDGSRIVYGRISNDRAEPYVMNANGTNKQPLGGFGANQYSYPQAISPDGNTIALDFSDGVTLTSREIYKVGINGGVPVNLTNNNVLDLFGAWSPDSQKIAFRSRRDAATDEIYTMNADGSAVVRLTFNTAADSVADWYKPAPPRRAAFDFDGDGKADVSVFRPSNGAWYLNQSTSGFVGLQFGATGDRIVPADYDGDGKTDVAVFRAGVWYLNRSQLGFTGIQFGAADDIPMPADYDGDGKADLAVFRPASGAWYLQQSTAGFTGVNFGQMGDVPVAADYDGDGKADVAVFRGGTCYLNRSQLGFTGVAFGNANDKPSPADYDGDGKADVAVFRPADGTWYLQRSQTGFTGIQFGQSGDVPAAADYDGDGKVDVAVFRNGTWYLNRTQTGFTSVSFGTTGDKAVPNAFIP